MGSYRIKAHARVQAWEVTNQSAAMIAQHVGGRVVIETTLADEQLYAINVPTLEGVVRASQGEFVVMEPDGTVKVLGASRFHEIYEENRR